MADEWLHRYPGKATVMAYIGRSGWDDLSLTGIPGDELLEAVDESYQLVVEGLPKKLRPTAGTPDLSLVEEVALRSSTNEAGGGE